MLYEVITVQETEIRDTDNQINITPREFTPISIFGSEDDYASQELLIDELSVITSYSIHYTKLYEAAGLVVRVAVLVCVAPVKPN